MDGSATHPSEPLVSALVADIVRRNQLGRGDYVIVIQPTVDENGTVYTWQWFWKPEGWRELTGGGS